MTGPRNRLRPRLRAAGSLLAAGLLLAAPARGSGLDARIQALGLDAPGVELGIEVMIEGRGVVFSRFPGTPRAAASAIKSAVLLDLIASYGSQLEEIPAGVEVLLHHGTHPAFRGFSRDQLSRARSALAGRSYLELARIMMGRTEAENEVYNAACNIIMIKLGGPQAITRRLWNLDESLKGIDINRYMQVWNGDGDNRATPKALVSLYRMAASGQTPGLDAGSVALWRSLLLDAGDGGPGSRFEKLGTLFPSPMVRVHAGYVQRAGGNLVYAVMGEIPDAPRGEDAAEVFARLMNAVDAVAAACWTLEAPPR